MVEDDHLGAAADLIEATRRDGPDLLLPVDLIVASSFAERAARRTVDAQAVPEGWTIMDIGPHTRDRFSGPLEDSGTVLWNGTMGVFEWEPFADGTVAVANTLASLEDVTTVVGGGSTAEAVWSLGLAEKMTHVSTGGGASLEFLEGRVLPGVDALMDRKAS